MAGESYNVTRSVDTYLTAGVPPQKLMLGIPWFGYNWPVTSNVRKATATGKAISCGFKCNGFGRKVGCINPDQGIAH